MIKNSGSGLSFFYVTGNSNTDHRFLSPSSVAGSVQGSSADQQQKINHKRTINVEPLTINHYHLPMPVQQRYAVQVCDATTALPGPERREHN